MAENHLRQTLDKLRKAEARIKRLEKALRDEIRWNIEGTGIHPDQHEEVIDRHFRDAAEGKDDG